MGGRHSFSGNSYHSTHSVILSQQPLSFILFFLVKDISAYFYVVVQM